MPDFCFFRCFVLCVFFEKTRKLRSCALAAEWYCSCFFCLCVCVLIHSEFYQKCVTFKTSLYERIWENVNLKSRWIITGIPSLELKYPYFSLRKAENIFKTCHLGKGYVLFPKRLCQALMRLDGIFFVDLQRPASWWVGFHGQKNQPREWAIRPMETSLHLDPCRPFWRLLELEKFPSSQKTSFNICKLHLGKAGFKKNYGVTSTLSIVFVCLMMFFLLKSADIKKWTPRFLVGTPLCCRKTTGGATEMCTKSDQNSHSNIFQPWLCVFCQVYLLPYWCQIGVSLEYGHLGVWQSNGLALTSQQKIHNYYW